MSALDAVIEEAQRLDPRRMLGSPMSLAVALIDEDPAQPRTEFEEQSLRELAATIGDRGVRQPISVRTHPSRPGRWMLNFGARRLRATKLAGKADIPAFVDETADTYDQVIENEQRQGLQPLELALFIQRRMQAGDSQADVARRLGKSRMYVTYLCSLIDASDWLMTVYRTGKCRGVAELHELARLHEVAGAAVEAWAEARATITRADVREFRQQVGRPDGVTAVVPSTTGSEAITPIGTPGAAPAADLGPAGPRCDAALGAPAMVTSPGDPPRVDPVRSRVDTVRAARAVSDRPELLVRWQREEVELVLDRMPDHTGCFFIRLPGSVEQRQVPAAELTLLRFADPGPIAS